MNPKDPRNRNRLSAGSVRCSADSEIRVVQARIKPNFEAKFQRNTAKNFSGIRHAEKDKSVWLRLENEA